MNKRITALTSTALIGAVALAIAACSTPADTTGTEEPANSIQDASGTQMAAGGDQTPAPADTAGTEEPASSTQDTSGTDMEIGDSEQDNALSNEDNALTNDDNIIGEPDYIEDPDEFETPDGEGVGVNAPGADGTAPPAGSGTEPQVIETPGGAFSVGSEGDLGGNGEVGEPEEDIPPSE